MSLNAEAREIVRTLQLEPLPREGGFFRVTWRTAAGSAIYFLLSPEDFSAWHRMPTDELWHFHAGDPIEHWQLDARCAPNELRLTRLGANVLAGEAPQCVAPGGIWQAARSVAPVAGTSPHGWSLLSCTMAPAWDESVFELGERHALERQFGRHAEIVRALTR